MKASGRLSDLRSALAVAVAVPERRNVIQILSHARLSLNAAGDLEITTTDLDCEYRETIGAEVSEPGSMTVPVHMLNDVVRAMSGDDFAIELDMAGARLWGGSAKFDLPILPVSDFPDFHRGDDWQTATLASKDLERLLDHAAPFTRKEPAYVNSGVYLHVCGSELRAVATDTARCAYASAPATVSADDLKCIVPNKTVALVLKALGDYSGPVEIAVSQSLVRFTMGGAVLTSRLIVGPFFTYERGIPAQYENRATVGREALKSAVRRASIIGDAKDPFLRASFAPDKLSLVGRCTFGFGEASDALEVDYSGAPMTMTLLSRHLSEGLAMVNADTVEIHMNGPKQPMRLVDPSDREKVLVTMPLGIGA